MPTMVCGWECHESNIMQFSDNLPVEVSIMICTPLSSSWLAKFCIIYFIARNFKFVYIGTDLSSCGTYSIFTLSQGCDYNIIIQGCHNLVQPHETLQTTLSQSCYNIVHCKQSCTTVSFCMGCLLRIQSMNIYILQVFLQLFLM